MLEFHWADFVGSRLPFLLDLYVCFGHWCPLQFLYYSLRQDILIDNQSTDRDGLCFLLRESPQTDSWLKHICYWTLLQMSVIYLTKSIMRVIIKRLTGGVWKIMANMLSLILRMLLGRLVGRLWLTIA